MNFVVSVLLVVFCAVGSFVAIALVISVAAVVDAAAVLSMWLLKPSLYRNVALAQRAHVLYV